jgi:hypothetical protein|tara:strand:- start:209 stop:466 length:258 start_codon:yes stop_codon:yes gene_type:complete
MKKYVILEQHKFSAFNDSWSVKFANLDEQKAMQKYVALNNLNDNKDISYHLVNMADFWQDPNDKPLVLKDEVKDNGKDINEDMPF